MLPRGDSTLVNRTVTVQNPPGASTAPVQLSGPASTPTLKKYVNREPPEVAMFVTVICAPPVGAVLVNVTRPVPVRFPDGRVMVSGFGVIDTVARDATPVPVRVTGEPVTVAPV